MIKQILFSGLVMMSSVAAAHSDEDTRVIDLSQVMGITQLVDKVADRQVIFVSETHDRLEHHLNQLEVIKGQYAHHPDMAIGLEFFQRPFQSALDDYVAKRISEAEFLKKSEYFERWGYDYRLYQPILSFAREHGIPLIALNTEREITDQVRQGGMESLSEEQLQRVPREIDRSNASYRARLEKVFKDHPMLRNADFERFLDIQLLWDEGMAERAADWFREHPQGHMTILAGAGHLMYGSGIPDRLLRRMALSSAIVLNAGANEDISADMGDYLIMTEVHSLPPMGHLGVILDTDVSPPKVKGFGQASGAKEAGMKEGDQIVSIDDNPITEYADIRIALLNGKLGDKVKVKVQRKSLVLDAMTHSFDVELK